MYILNYYVDNTNSGNFLRAEEMVSDKFERWDDLVLGLEKVKAYPYRYKMICVLSQEELQSWEYEKLGRDVEKIRDYGSENRKKRDKLLSLLNGIPGYKALIYNTQREVEEAYAKYESRKDDLSVYKEEILLRANEIMDVYKDLSEEDRRIVLADAENILKGQKIADFVYEIRQSCRK